MSEIIKKYKNYNEKKSTKIIRFILIYILIFSYLYFILVWSPDTYVSLINTSKIDKLIRGIITFGLSLYITLEIDINFFQVEKSNDIQIDEYNLWSKFLLHFAFLKTGTSNEKTQVFEVLSYVEDSQLKADLSNIYENSQTLKDAHNEIIKKYPYPHIKTFFAESEDALVNAEDREYQLQKTTMHINKYMEDIKKYKSEKQKSYNVAFVTIMLLVVLTAVGKITLANIFLDFTMKYTTFAILIIYCICLVKLLTKAKKELNKTLVNFGDEHVE